MKVKLSDLNSDMDTFPQEALAELVRYRVAVNLANTGHPFHHQTVDGTIVDSDPTLEYAIKRLEATCAPTVPINRSFYGFDLYAGK